MAQPLALASLPLTFGIELEMVFAFHEDRLQGRLKQHNPDAFILKSIDHPLAAAGLHHKCYQHLKYQSWVLGNAGINPTTAKPCFRRDSGRFEYRAYIDEPLHIARNIIANKVERRQGMKVYNSTDHSKQATYEDWTISGDRSLTGMPKDNMVQELQDRITSLDVAKDWDSWGMEIISPPYSSIESVRNDLSEILSAVKGTAQADFGVTVTDNCGLHVHIGLPDSAILPLKTLQHLAYILIVYEEEIDRLHAPSRRQRDDEIRSNRENFYAECPEPVERWVMQDNGVRVLKKFEPVFKPLDEIRRSIFDTVDKSADPLARLISLMGREKGKIVNFSYLNREGRPQTVEFRQHAGTIDEEEVFWWVQFCLGLVRLADEYAQTGTECPVKSWEDDIRIEDLFSAMQLSDEGRRFLERKMAAYAADAKAPKPIGYWNEWEDEFEDEGCILEEY